MLPEREINRLVNTVLEAVELAAVERRDEGYECLREGLRYAQEARRSGRRWADELGARYQEALCNYVDRYHPALRAPQTIYRGHRAA